jgi:hypothetical protein
MSRYVIMTGRSCGFDWYEQPAPPLPHPMSYVAEPARTGILDQDGNDIFKVPDPVGFLAK